MAGWPPPRATPVHTPVRPVRARAGGRPLPRGAGVSPPERGRALLARPARSAHEPHSSASARTAARGRVPASSGGPYSASAAESSATTAAPATAARVAMPGKADADLTSRAGPGYRAAGPHGHRRFPAHGCPHAAAGSTARGQLPLPAPRALPFELPTRDLSEPRPTPMSQASL